MIDWVLRLFKGAIIGIGFILPGVSGGALAVIFGLYQRIIDFLAHFTQDFIKNILFFLPVGLGGVLGLYFIARPLDFLLEQYNTQVVWGFIGCIVGTIPALWRETGKNGRSKRHFVIVIISTLICMCIFAFSKGIVENKETSNQDVEIVVVENGDENIAATEIDISGDEGVASTHIGTFVLAGFLISVGVMIPGLSSSTLLLYFGILNAVLVAVKNNNITMMTILFISTIAFIIPLSKIMSFLLKKVYAVVFHIIFGIVIASTLMIVPVKYNYLSAGVLVCVVTFLAGITLGWWMSRLEDQYKR